MGGYASATSYDPNGTLRQLTSAPSAMGAPVPGAGAVDPNAINALMAYKMKLAADQQAQENNRANRALKLQEWMAQNAQAARETDRNDAMMAGSMRQAPQQQEVQHGKPVFTKTVGGAGITPGTIRLGAWEPGAAFSGYEEDLGTGPANAVMSTAAGQSQAASRGLAADEWEQYKKDTAARQRVPTYGVR